MKHTHTQPSAKSETNYLARGEIQQVQLIPLKDIVSSETNPREKETPEELAELMASIKEKGLIQPITVRAFGDKGQYEVVAGHRRLWAHRELKASEIRAFVVELADSEAAEFQLVENLQRADIHPLREAEALKALEKNISFKIIAERIGKPESYIAQRLQLLSLNKESRKLYLEKVLTTPHALLLAKWTADDQLKALDFLFDGDWKRTKPDNLIARDVKELKVWIEMEIEMHLTQAPWDKNDAELIPGVPACLACPKNSGYNTALFPELNKKHVCNDRACFHAKMQAYFKQTRHASKKEEQKDFILLSENYGMNTSDPMYVKGAVKMNGRYVELKDEKKTCEHTKKGQYIDGPKKGKFVLVCNYSKCAKHWKVSERQSSSGDNYNSPANVAKREAAKKEMEQKISEEREFRYNVMTAMLEKCPKKVTLDLVRGILLASTETLRFSVYRQIARRHEWTEAEILYKDANTSNEGKELVVKALETLILKCGETELMKLYCEIEYSRLMDVENHWDIQQTELLEQAEKLFKIDLKKIRKETASLMVTEKKKSSKKAKK